MQTSGKRGGKPKDFRTAPPGEAAWAEVRSAAGAVADADGRGGAEALLMQRPGGAGSTEKAPAAPREGAAGAVMTADGPQRGATAGGGNQNTCWSFLACTMASTTATAVMLTTSRTEQPKSVKWMGLFSPICIGPSTSAASVTALIIL